MFNNLSGTFRKSGTRRAEAGQSLVEVAMLMPVLVLILAGILDLGRAYMTLVALNDAAAEGAAYAALHPTYTTQIVQRTASSSSALVSLEPSMVSVAYAEPLTAGMPVTVTVMYPYRLLTPFISGIVPSGTLTLRASEVRSIIGN